jgi:gas vesicle protein
MSDPDQIREDIERTRRELGADVDALADKVSPSSIAQRQTDKVKGALGGAVNSVKERVMGVADDVKTAGSSALHSAGGHASSAGGSLSSAGSSVGSSLSSAGSSVAAAPGRAVSAAKGNPLAVGLIAFGAGWLVSSLIPATGKEQELASNAKEAVAPLKEKVTDAAKEVAQNLKEPAQEAAQSVKGTAQEAVSTVKDEGASAASDLKGSAQDAKQSVQDQTS